MSKKFIQGKPDNLDALLASYNPGDLCNVSHDEVIRSVLGYTQTDFNALFGPHEDGTPIPKHIDVYCYFPMDEESIQLRLGFNQQIHIALSLRNYGFPDDAVVTLNPVRIPLTLSDQALIVYEKILRSSSYNLNELLDAVGFIVNDSMEYDFDKFIAAEAKLGRNTTGYEVQRKRYVPTGREVIKGTCDDAGSLIRKILLNLGLEDRYKFTFVGSNNGVTAHATTVVFDTQTGTWAIINSKSYAKDYNLVPLKKIGELGIPYTKQFPEQALPL